MMRQFDELARQLLPEEFNKPFDNHAPYEADDSATLGFGERDTSDKGYAPYFEPENDKNTDTTATPF
jgi:hypothetical protein